MKIFYFFELLPFANFDIENLTAENLISQNQKALQLGASNLVGFKRIISRLLGEVKKIILFFQLLPFANFDIENLISQKTLQLGAPKMDS